MVRRWNLSVGVVLAILLVAVLAARVSFKDAEAAQKAAGSAQMPIYQVDPLWPKTLPNHWILTPVIGVSVDQ